MNAAEIVSVLRKGLVLVSGEVNFAKAVEVVAAAESAAGGLSLDAGIKALQDNADAVFLGPVAKGVGLAFLAFLAEVRAA